MKRILVFLAAALTAFSVAQAESDTDSTFVFGPADTETAAPEVTPSPTPIPLLEDNGDSSFDFSQVDNPLATPVAIDPIDKPTPTPAPTPNYAYETYTNDMMAISFDIPYTWLLNPATNQETTIQFVEPKSERMDVDGYLQSIATLRAAMDDPRCPNIAGLYMEGPYLNPKFGCDKESNPPLRRRST